MRFLKNPPSVFNHDASAEENKKDSMEEIEYPDESDWKYGISVSDVVEVGGREVKTIDRETDDVYAGDIVRQMMEARKYRPKSYTWIGYTKKPNRGVEEVGIPHQSLFRHTAIFGTTGYGKSTVVRNLNFQWMQAGWGVCFMDPKGGDIKEYPRILPEQRIDDLVWVEPGNPEREKVVGFNIFDTYSEAGSSSQDAEAQQITSDFVDIIRQDVKGGRRGGEWTPEMTGVAKAIIGQLIRAEEDYTIVDFYQILDNQAERDAFLDMYGDKMEEIERDYVENLDPRSVENLIERVKSIATDKITRQMLANEDSNINIGEVVEEGKILLIDASNMDDDDIEFICSAIARRIWSTIKARKDIPMGDRIPYFLAMDEFHDIAQNSDDEPNLLKVKQMLRKARSLRLSVLISSQQPSQLSESIQTEIYGNCENTLTFNPGEHRDAGSLAKGIGDIDAFQLLELDRFTLLGRVTIDGSKSDPLLINTFPEYPPIRTEEEGEKVVERSLDRYGTIQKEQVDSEQMGVIRYQKKKEVDTFEHNGFTLKTRHAVAAFEAESKARCEDWVSAKAVQKVFERHFEGIDYSQVLSDLVRPNIGKYFRRKESDGVEYYKVTQEGRELISPPSENEEYGRLTAEGMKKLSDVGYLTFLSVDDEIGEYFEAVGYPPISTMDGVASVERAKKLYNSLEGTYPELVDRFSDRTTLLCPVDIPYEEAERVAKSIKNCEDNHIVFAVNEREHMGETNKQCLAKMLRDGEFADQQSEKTIFYPRTELLSLGEDLTPLVREKHTKWVKDSPNIRLEDTSGHEICKFSDFEEIRSVPEMYPYYAIEEDKDITDDNGNIVGEETIVEVYNSDGERYGEYKDMDEAFSDGFFGINPPFVPEQDLDELPNVEYHHWSILVIPEDGDPYFLEDQM